MYKRPIKAEPGVAFVTVVNYPVEIDVHAELPDHRSNKRLIVGFEVEKSTNNITKLGSHQYTNRVTIPLGSQNEVRSMSSCHDKKTEPMRSKILIADHKTEKMFEADNGLNSNNNNALNGQDIDDMLPGSNTGPVIHIVPSKKTLPHESKRRYEYLSKCQNGYSKNGTRVIEKKREFAK